MTAGATIFDSDVGASYSTRLHEMASSCPPGTVGVSVRQQAAAAVAAWHGIIIAPTI